METSLRKRTTPPLHDRVLARVNVEPAPDPATGTPCWTWTGSRNHAGWPLLHHEGLLRRAHRVIWAEANGPIPEGLWLSRRCGNRACVRLDHLYLRAHSCDWNKGEENGQAKLTDDDVTDIREMRVLGFTQREVADLYGISPANVALIAGRHRWKHVP